MVEHDLAKVGVAGSTPVSRSIFRYILSHFSNIPLPNLHHPLRFAVCRPLFLSALLVASFLTPLWAQSVTLRSSYTIDTHLVTLKTFGIDTPQKTILDLPKKRMVWKVPAFRIEAKLKALGFEVTPPPTSMITFKRAVSHDFPKLRKLLEERYRRRYPTLRIERVTIRPTSAEGLGFTFHSGCSLRLSDTALRKNRGTFVVHCGTRRNYFRYAIEGSILVYKANHQIKKDKIIDPKSTTAEYTVFKKFYAPPLTEPGGGYIARQNIPAGRILTEANTDPLPAVLKGQRVRCLYGDGGVRIEFDATAMQSGGIGDEITVKKSGGKTLRGTVVGTERVEIK